MESLRAVVLVPVKPLGRAKTRLRGRLGARTDALVLAMALDTIAAASDAARVARVVVITDDPVLAAACAGAGVDVEPDAPRSGLNAALRKAARACAIRQPHLAVVAQPADCPAVRPADFNTLIAAVASTGGRVFLPDTAATGTTVLAAAPGVPLDPRYGPRSGQAHADSGAVALHGPQWEHMARDVDVWSDLLAAAALGVGARTRQWLAGAGRDR